MVIALITLLMTLLVDPMVNGRMRAGGASVKMAVGGLVPTGTYGDINKVDGIIKQLMTAANNDPNLMQKLSSKGIMLNTTGADQKSAEMKQANKPQDPLKDAEGTLVEPRAFKLGGDIAENINPFDLGKYGTLGGKLFEAAGLEDPVKTINDTILNENGKIQEIILISPNGMEIPFSWNTAVPIDDFINNNPGLKGYTVKSIEPSVADVVPDGISPQSPIKKDYDDGPSEATGQASGSGGGGLGITGFNYRKATPEALEAKYNQVKNFRNVGAVVSVIAGPVGVVIGMAAKANHAVVTRRIEIELNRRVALPVGDPNRITPETVLEKPKNSKIKTVKNLMGVVNTEVVEGKNFISDIFVGAADTIFDKVAQNAADKIQEKINQDLDPTSTAKPAKVETIVQTEGDKVKAMQDAQNIANFNREEKEREAAQAAARAAQAARRYQSSGGGGGDNSSIANQIEGQNPSLSRGEALSAAAKTKSYSSNTGGYDEAPSVAAGEASGGYDKSGASDYDDDTTGVYKGGLLAKPAAKKQKNKKQTTQRRKGLGTRP